MSLHQLFYFLSLCLLLHQLLELSSVDPLSPGPSALAEETEGAPETIYLDPDVPEPAVKGYPNGVLLCLVVLLKHRCSNKRLPVRT